MSGVFRELFNELSAEAFALVKGIGEQAVALAQPQAQPVRQSQTSRLVDTVNDGHVGRWLCNHYGWKRVRMTRKADCESVLIRVILHCGHVQHMTIDESSIEDVQRDRVFDLIDRIWHEGRRKHPCYCVPREGTTQT